MVPTEIRVIYGDTDQMGVAYYANYLRYFEAGRNEFLRGTGVRYRDVESAHGILLPVVEATVRYKHPARYDDLIRVETWIAELGRASLRFEYRVVRTGDERLLTEGHTAHVCVDREHKPRRLPEELRRLLEPRTGMHPES
ncbi:acyl-CoA thioesterase [Vulgatibacter incomptus]|uniref:4-hydroxybenzoyl-CoA thioesterase family active site protein n=1 Tax=Vulgatibacter incomptus TaxID=1391653 RepID=A0A0K1PBJ4_9BACT|nr:thioesterase family protein [Vulgatibacter incomptus]AKU90895.1 4-hydroxybenzoyl-CoA thioesterase family active site protein [Vulgatibacter incomptus]